MLSSCVILSRGTCLSHCEHPELCRGCAAISGLGDGIATAPDCIGVLAMTCGARDDQDGLNGLRTGVRLL